MAASTGTARSNLLEPRSKWSWINPKRKRTARQMGVSGDNPPDDVITPWEQGKERDPQLRLIIWIYAHITAVHARTGRIEDLDRAECGLQLFGEPHLQLCRYSRGDDDTAYRRIGTFKAGMCRDFDRNGRERSY